MFVVSIIGVMGEYLRTALPVVDWTSGDGSLSIHYCLYHYWGKPWSTFICCLYHF